MIHVKRMKLSKGLVLSLIIHGLLLYALLNTSIGNKNIQSSVKKNQPINSYIYTKKVSIDKPKVEIEYETAKQETKQTPIQQSELQQETQPAPSINTVAPQTKQVSNQAIEIKTESVTTINHKKNSAPANAIFNPYESMLRVNKNLDQAMIEDVIKTRKSTKGISDLQGFMPSVPSRQYVKSSLQKREEATTIVGNETFIKLNGTCAQSTDLSFIDENLGSVTSYSDCGETDDEKYFREFMKKTIDK